MKSSIQKDVFYSSIGFSSVILIIFGLFFTNTLYQSGMETARNVIKQRNYAVNFFIDGFFSKTNNTIEFLAADERVQNGPYLADSDKKELLALYKLLGSNSKYVSYIYSAYENKELFLPDYTPSEGYDPTERPWYLNVIADKSKLSTGLPYYNLETQDWSFASGKALFSEKRGFTGVISSDSPIDAIVDQLHHLGGLYESSYSFVTKSDGQIILHQDDLMLNKNINAIIDVPVNFYRSEGPIEQSVNGEQKIAYYSHCEEVDWVVVTIVDKQEVTSVIQYKIFFYLLLTGAISILLGFTQSIILSNRFSEPLLQLQCKIKYIINGQGAQNCAFKYPDNEIGVIAEEISNLTSKEFYAKSKALEKSNEQLEKKNLELQRLSITDPLTELYNRHKIDAELSHEFGRASRYGGTFSLLILDIDWFKKVNDSYGHQAGDSVIKEIAVLLKNSSRDIDMVGRWGGEEFIILCPRINVHQALELADRIRCSIELHSFSINTSITVSIGVAEFNHHETIINLIKRTDDNLYVAKHNGRNCILG